MRAGWIAAGALLCLLGLTAPTTAAPSIQAGPAAETEPNDDFASATGFDATAGAAGAFPATTEWDYYRFTTDGEFAASRWTLQLQPSGEGARRLCLLDDKGTELQCREGAAPALPDLVLPAGEHGVAVSNRDAAASAYTLSFERTGETSPDDEAEPNDTLASASAISDRRAIRGRFAGSEDDLLRFTVEGEPQLWRVQAQGEGIETLAYVEPDGGEPISQPARGEKRIRLDDLYLLPGEHALRVRGADGAYTVRLLPVGPPPAAPGSGAATGSAGPLIPVTEREPNNDASRATRLRFGQAESGRLSNPDDRDLYRFSLAAPEHVRLTVTPPPDGQAQVDLAGLFSNATRPPGEPVTLETVLGPGDFLVNLDAAQISELPYRILLERLDPLDLPADLEPFNNDRAAAPSIPPTLSVSGRVQPAGDWVDWFRLPDAPAATELALAVAGGPGVELRAGDATLYPVRQDPATGAAVYAVPAATPLVAGVSGDGAYTLTASFADGPSAAPTAPAPSLAMALSGGESPAAFVDMGQRLDLTLILTNTGTETLPLTLTAATSDLGWTPALPDGPVSLAPGETRRAPVGVTLPADLAADRPVRITVRAETEDGAGVSALTEIAAVCAAPPVNPDPTWSSAGPLAGGLNVAWSGLGGRLVDDPGTDASALNDGRVSPATGYRAPVGSAVTVDLAGDAPWPIAGVLLHPQGRQDPAETLRAFEVALSENGVTFTPALRGELSAAPFEQSFPLPAPIAARFARLTLLSAAGGGDRVGLGEWKVVAQPDAAPESGPLNLLDPAAGGHIVSASPLPADMQAVLTERDDALVIRTERDGGAAWTAGFQENRAAQITELQWRNAATTRPEQGIPAVRVSYSLESPIGPWQPLAEWKLDAASTVTQTLTLATPTWVRFLRYDVPAAPADRDLALPDRLAALERPIGEDGYRSALAEWGQDRRAAFYERSLAAGAAGETVAGETVAGETGSRPAGEQEPNDTPETAQPLAPDAPVAGTVQAGSDEDWYHIAVPTGMQRLDVMLANDRAGQVTYELLDATGNAVPYTVEDAAEATMLTAAVTPGEYRLRVSQPRRSVVFAWDTSGSVAPYVPIIYPALSAFVTGMNPTQEAVNLLPFSEQPRFLLQEFSSDPEMLLRALQNYPRADASSNAEATLAHAAQVLGERPGERAILLITDADSNGYAQTGRLWQALEQARPRVFALEMSSSGLAHGQDLMRDWASVGGGGYTQAATAQALETGFARAACALRGGAPYTVSATLAAEPPPPPPPGSIAVMPAAATEAAPTAGAAVEFIVDASGSMLQRMGSQRRIDIAKSALTHMTSEVLPAGTPLALRAFGHREAGSCRTDLEIPLGPLDPAAVGKVIAGLQAKDGAKTPIAAALRLTADDLRAAPGPKLLILLTDGEETCGGDPAAELERLRDLGLDVRVNIVGFGVDDAKTEKLFRDWAASAGGQYLPAKDAGELRAAVAAALRAPFRVLDASGAVVAEGTVGGPAVTAASGAYTVEVLTSPPRRFEDVILAPGEAVKLTY